MSETLKLQLKYRSVSQPHHPGHPGDIRPLIGHLAIIELSDWSVAEACQLARPQTWDLGKNWPAGEIVLVYVFIFLKIRIFLRTLNSPLCVVLRIRMLKSFLTLCINSGQRMHLYNFPRTFCSELEKSWKKSFSVLRET